MTTKKLLTRLIRISRGIDKKLREFEAVVGGDVGFLEKETAKLDDLIMELSGVNAKRAEYTVALVKMGAANVSWLILEIADELFCNADLTSDQLAQHLLDYGSGGYDKHIPSQREVDESKADIPNYGLLTCG